MDSPHSHQPDTFAPKDEESVSEVMIDEVIEESVAIPDFGLAFAQDVPAPVIAPLQPSLAVTATSEETAAVAAPQDEQPAPPRSPRRQATVVKTRRGGGKTVRKPKSGATLGQLRETLSSLYATVRRSRYLRIALILTPVALAIVVSYAGNSIIFGATTREIDARVIDRGSDGVRMTINGGRVTIPFPEGYELIATEQFFSGTTLARGATEADSFTTIAVGRPESRKEAAYFVTVSAIGESWQTISERDFRRLKSQMQNRKEIQSSFSAAGVLDVFSPTDHSICFGRSVTTGHYSNEPQRSFYQLSCLLLYRKRALILNCGYEAGDGDKVDPQQVRDTLLNWRRQLINE